LQNQKNLGTAFRRYYGQPTGDKLAALLTTHIHLAVPVLTAAKSGDKERGIGQRAQRLVRERQERLLTLSPQSTPRGDRKVATESIWKGHIDTSVGYAVDLLKGDYAKAIKDYDAAYHHMMLLVDLLARSTITQFPEKF